MPWYAYVMVGWLAFDCAVWAGKVGVVYVVTPGLAAIYVLRACLFIAATITLAGRC